MNDMTVVNSSSANLIELTTEIVSAYVAKNSLPAGELPAFLQSVYSALGALGTAAKQEPIEEELKPAVSIKKSITDDYLISLFDGQKFRSLKRHLMTTHGLTPQQYRDKWGLPKDYPMVAPGYAKARSDLAKGLGLGRKAMPTPMPVPTADAAPGAPTKKAGRPKKTAEAAE